MSTRLRTLCAAIGAVLGTAAYLPAATAATTVVVDFESFNLAGGTYLDMPETLTFANVSGSGVSMEIRGHDDLRIYDLQLYGGYSQPGRQAMIDMNWSNYRNPAGTDILFSQGVSHFSLQAGDFGGDDDGLLRIEAFGDRDQSLGVASTAWVGGKFPPLSQLTLNVTGIHRVHYSSGGAYANSTFIDNISFSVEAPAAPVPEPSRVALLVSGLGLVGGILRRQRR